MRRHITGGVTAIIGLMTAATGFAPGGAPASAASRIAERSAAIRQVIDAEIAGLETLYKDLHAHPELSLMEVRTAARMAKELQSLGFEVTTGVGGTGVVGILKN